MPTPSVPSHPPSPHLDPEGPGEERAPSYAHRPRPFSPEVSWRLYEDVVVIDSGRRIDRIPYRRFAGVRLTYRPANVTSQGYRARFVLDDRKTLTLSNLSWKTYFEVERQDEAYTGFIRELVARIGAARPDFDGQAGQPFAIWLAACIVGAVMAFAYAGALAWAVSRQAWALAGVAALFLLPFGWQAWGMAVRNRPAPFRPGHIPAMVLPPAPKVRD